MPILLKEAYGILELVNAAGVLYLEFIPSGRGNFDYCIAIEEDYEIFSKYWEFYRFCLYLYFR